MRGIKSPARWSRRTKIIVVTLISSVLVVVVGFVIYAKVRDDFDEALSPGVLEITNNTSETLLLHEYPFGDGPGFGLTGVFLVPAYTTVRAQCGGGFSETVLGDQAGMLIHGPDVRCPSGGKTRRVVIEESDIADRSTPPYPAPTGVTPENAIPKAK